MAASRRGAMGKKKGSGEGPVDISSIADAVIADYPGKILEYQAGIRPALDFLITEAIKRTGGKADPDKVRQAIINKL
jgi:Asp-tRNA(Asn)/Glu-tRNA(Gln) amidotransferase B subunit